MAKVEISIVTNEIIEKIKQEPLKVEVWSVKQKSKETETQRLKAKMSTKELMSLDVKFRNTAIAINNYDHRTKEKVVGYNRNSNLFIFVADRKRTPEK